MSDDEGWTTVQHKKNKPKSKDHSYTPEYSSGWDDDTIIIRKKPDHSKVGKRIALREGNYTTVATGKVGQRDNYDPRRMAKLDNATETGKLRTVTKDFARKIQQARSNQGLSQKELANKMNVPLTVVNQYEKGTAITDGATLQKFKNVLKI